MGIVLMYFDRNVEDGTKEEEKEGHQKFDCHYDEKKFKGDQKG